VLKRLVVRAGLRRVAVARPGGGAPQTFDGTAREADR
jgi:hypothetical protein